MSSTAKEVTAVTQEETLAALNVLGAVAPEVLYKAFAEAYKANPAVTVAAAANAERVCKGNASIASQKATLGEKWSKTLPSGKVLHAIPEKPEEEKDLLAEGYAPPAVDLSPEALDLGFVLVSVNGEGINAKTTVATDEQKAELAFRTLAAEGALSREGNSVTVAGVDFRLSPSEVIANVKKIPALASLAGFKESTLKVAFGKALPRK